jgi:hypothetical protein
MSGRFHKEPGISGLNGFPPKLRQCLVEIHGGLPLTYPVKGYRAAMGAEGHSIESLRMTCDQVNEQCCEGRGWRPASQRRVIRGDENVMRMVRRACPDCSPILPSLAS